MTKRYKVVLTEAEHHALCALVDNGWGGGDASGWGGYSPATQRRAMRKLIGAPKDNTPALVKALQGLVWCCEGDGDEVHEHMGDELQRILTSSDLRYARRVLRDMED